MERSGIFIPYDVTDGAQHLPSGKTEDVRQHLLKLNVFHIIWPGYLCVLKEPAKMCGEVLYLQIWGKSKDVGDCQGSSRTLIGGKRDTPKSNRLVSGTVSLDTITKNLIQASSNKALEAKMKTDANQQGLWKVCLVK